VGFTLPHEELPRDPQEIRGRSVSGMTAMPLLLRNAPRFGSLATKLQASRTRSGWYRRDGAATIYLEFCAYIVARGAKFGLIAFLRSAFMLSLYSRFAF
jgi:hypothetical protein